MDETKPNSEIKMLDFNGNEIVKGSNVIFAAKSASECYFTRGKVERLFQEEYWGNLETVVSVRSRDSDKLVTRRRYEIMLECEE